MSNEIDWTKLKIEYVRGKMTLTALAEKYEINRGNLSKHSKEEKWSEARTAYRQRTAAKALTRASTRDARKLAALRSAADTAAELIKDAVSDPKLLHRHVVISDGVTKEEEFLAINPKALEALGKALLSMTQSLRNLYDIDTRAERAAQEREEEKMRIEREKLAMLKAKEETESDDIIVEFKGDLEEYSK